MVCTNLRELNGNRPVFADDIASVFVFPLMHIRFIEIAPGTIEQSPDDERPKLEANVPAVSPIVEADEELEIDEDFLRRVRDV